MCAVLRCLVSQDEQLAAAGLAPDGSHVVLASSNGLLAHFPLDIVRQSSRAAGCIKVWLIWLVCQCVMCSCHVVFRLRVCCWWSKDVLAFVEMSSVMWLLQGGLEC